MQFQRHALLLFSTLAISGAALGAVVNEPAARDLANIEIANTRDLVANVAIERELVNQFNADVELSKRRKANNRVVKGAQRSASRIQQATSQLRKLHGKKSSPAQVNNALRTVNSNLLAAANELRTANRRDLQERAMGGDEFAKRQLGGLPPITDLVTDVISSVVPTVTDLVTDVVSDVVSNSGVVPIVTDVVSDVLPSVSAVVTDVLSDIVPTGVLTDLPTSLVTDIISSVLPSVTDIVTDVLSSVTDVVSSVLPTSVLPTSVLPTSVLPTSILPTDTTTSTTTSTTSTSTSTTTTASSVTPITTLPTTTSAPGSLSALLAALRALIAAIRALIQAYVQFFLSAFGLRRGAAPDMKIVSPGLRSLFDAVDEVSASNGLSRVFNPITASLRNSVRHFGAQV